MVSDKCHVLDLMKAQRRQMLILPEGFREGYWSTLLFRATHHLALHPFLGLFGALSPTQWQAISLTVIEKVQIAAIVLGSLFLVASISWLIWSSLSPSAKWQRQDLLFQICYGMYGFMDVVCIGLIIHEGSSVYRIFKRWQAVNQQWKVLNYDKTKDIGGDAGGGTAGKPGPRTSRTGPTSGATSRPPAAQRMRTLLPQRCGYTILHLLGQLRPPDTRSSSHSGREVVMRVTTV